MKNYSGYFNTILEEIMDECSSFNGETKTIKKWAKDQLKMIQQNQLLLQQNRQQDKIEIFRILSIDLLMRSMQGERGGRIGTAIEQNINSLQDLNRTTFRRIMRQGRYRWGQNIGADVLCELTDYYRNGLNGDWNNYFTEASKRENVRNNFLKDNLLHIKNVNLKVRDLALSNFNKNYIAIDINIVRVITRLGLLNTGFDIIDPPTIEMGTNASKRENYLFMHHLLLNLVKESNRSLVEIDRAFWHFGRTVCKSKPNCGICSIRKYCPTGKALRKKLTNLKN